MLSITERVNTRNASGTTNGLSAELILLAGSTQHLLNDKGLWDGWPVLAVQTEDRGKALQAEKEKPQC